MSFWWCLWRFLSYHQWSSIFLQSKKEKPSDGGNTFTSLFICSYTSVICVFILPLCMLLNGADYLRYCVTCKCPTTHSLLDGWQYLFNWLADKKKIGSGCQWSLAIFRMLGEEMLVFSGFSTGLLACWIRTEFSLWEYRGTLKCIIYRAQQSLWSVLYTFLDIFEY